jgi:putative glutamine amidotransferase
MGEPRAPDVIRRSKQNLPATGINSAHMRPLIGVTTSELRPSEASTLRRHGEPAHPEMALGITYLRAVESAGGLPVVLPPVALDAVDGLLERLDGVVLSGGPDLDPDAYGARDRHPELGDTEPGLDAFELAVARAADRQGMPVLGVCRGAQALNVARGGTLHQHIEGHRQAQPAVRATHPVAIVAGSRLAAIVGRGPLRVNSFHHQAVDVPGAGVKVVARGPDGTVEAIEDPTGPLWLGVQWHAEGLVGQRVGSALFDALVAAAAAAPVRALRAA